MPDEVLECFNNYFSGTGSKIADDEFNFQFVDAPAVFHMLLSTFEGGRIPDTFWNFLI